MEGDTGTTQTTKPKFYRTTRFYIIIGGLIALTVTPTLVYYSLSYNSVSGTHPELVTASKSASYFEATFYVTIHVWSWAGSLNTEVNQPTFTLTVDNLPFGSQTGTSAIFQPNNFLTYTFAFKTTDSGIAQAVRNSNTNYLVVQMSAEVSAGWYRSLLTKSDSHAWTYG